MNRLSTDVNFTALVKPAVDGNPAERYVYSWADAAVMSNEIRKQLEDES